MAATSAHPLLPPLAEAYKEVPKTTTPPTFSETKLVLEDEKEVVAARVDFVYPTTAGSATRAGAPSWPLVASCDRELTARRRAKK